MSHDNDLFSMDDLPQPVDPRSLGCEPLPPQFTPGSTFVPGQRKSVSAEEVEIAFFPLSDGRTALLAYTSVARLVECLGPHQPWLEIKPIINVATLQLRVGADLVIWDQPLPDELRHHEENS